MFMSGGLGWAMFPGHVCILCPCANAALPKWRHTCSRNEHVSLPCSEEQVSPLPQFTSGTNFSVHVALCKLLIGCCLLCSDHSIASLNLVPGELFAMLYSKLYMIILLPCTYTVYDDAGSTVMYTIALYIIANNFGNNSSHPIFPRSCHYCIFPAVRLLAVLLSV